MFIALCYQVYKVWNPEPPEVPKIHRPPATEVGDAVVIPQPPPPLGTRPRAETSSLLRNPFTRIGGGTGDSSRDDQEIRLLRIIKWSDGSLRAELQDARERDYFAEGESFGTWEVISIDQEAGSVEVYSAESNKRLTLTLGR